MDALEECLKDNNIPVEVIDGRVYGIVKDGVFFEHPKSGDFGFIVPLQGETPRSQIYLINKYANLIKSETKNWNFLAAYCVFLYPVSLTSICYFGIKSYSYVAESIKKLDDPNLNSSILGFLLSLIATVGVGFGFTYFHEKTKAEDSARREIEHLLDKSLAGKDFHDKLRQYASEYSLSKSSLSL